MRKLLAITFILWASLCVAKGNGIAVFVGFVEKDGMASPEVKDSTKDVAEAIEKKGFSLVQDKSKADIVLTVLSRDSEYVKEGSQSIGYGISKDTHAEKRVILVRLEVGSFSEVVDGTITSRLASWRSCANVVARYVDKWAKSNRDAILKLRSR